ncbi:MAG: hypothetical protein IKH99_03285 [Prevotella sp.]|nr:hypothetical protein [Prevotella sp.]
MLITVVALLAYALIVFLGMEYLWEGIHEIALPLTLAGVAVLALCVYVMCKSKASRNKRQGLPREIIAIVIAVVTLYLGRTPFSQFFYVYDHQEELKQGMQETAESVAQIDSLYQHYAQQRLRNYRKELKRKRVSNTKTKALEKSLRRRLLPTRLDTIRVQRQQWLSSLGETHVWSLSTPRSIHYLLSASEQWTEQYQQVSSMIYQGEKAEAFNSDGMIGVRADQLVPFLSPQPADSRSLLVMVICCVLILTTYFHIRRPKSRYDSGHR